MTEISKDALVAAVVALAEAGIPTDTQELLLQGDPMRGIKPSALQSAIMSALATTEPSKPVAEAVKVKPLEWDAPDSWSWNLAKTVLGTYVVRPCLATNFAGQFLMCRPGDEDSVLFPSEDAAKAAAQADYEQRILSALEPKP